jgi:hypothetical protein
MLVLAASCCIAQPRVSLAYKTSYDSLKESVSKFWEINPAYPIEGFYQTSMRDELLIIRDSLNDNGQRFFLIQLLEKRKYKNVKRGELLNIEDKTYWLRLINSTTVQDVILTLKDSTHLLVLDKNDQRKFYPELIKQAEYKTKKTKFKKVALIIGNSNYQYTAPLKNPVNDASLITNTLCDLGFETHTYQNLTYQKMMQALREFSYAARDAHVVFFYFAGHGMQYHGSNFLLPIDARLANGPTDLSFETLSVETVFKILDYSNHKNLNVIILDACRNNPFSSWVRGGNTGLAELKPPSGSVIGFATSPGSIAYDGEQENGLYTAELVKQLKVNQRLEDVFMKTRIEVETKTRGEQSPWELFRLRRIYNLSSQ